VLLQLSALAFVAGLAGLGRRPRLADWSRA
jgi:hypothetical protein